MTSSALPYSSFPSRFDKVVVLAIVVVLGLTAVLIWRGDQVGVTAVQLLPADGATQVSTQAVLRVVFAQEMQTNRQPQLTIVPFMSGETAWEGNNVVFRPSQDWQPDTTYTIEVAAGLQNQSGRPLLRPITWQFRTGQPRIVYIGWQPGERNQLYVAIPGTPSQPLTQEEQDVLDYAVSPDGQGIVYSVLRADGGSDLWFIAPDGNGRFQLLECVMAACTQPVWSPDGRRLIYERREINAPGAPPGAPRLWWVDVHNGQTVAVFQDSQWLGLGVRFSPNGRWLSYISPLEQNIQAYNLENGQTISIPSKTGEPATWSPDGKNLLITEITFQGERFSIYLYQVNLETVELTNLSGDDAEVNDSFPVFSPDGEWLVLGRKLPRTAMGKQLWLMRPDGSEAVELTNDAEMHFGQPAWSPDGRLLAVQRYLLTGPGAQPGIWLFDVATQEMQEVASPGVQPAWLP